VRPALSRATLKPVFSFVLPTLLVTLLNIPAYWWANTLVARQAGFIQVGLFGAAYTLAQLIMLIPTNLYVPALTFMSEAHAGSEARVYSGLVSANFRLMWALVLPLALGCALLSPLLIGLLYGAGYSAAAAPGFVMSFTALLMIMVGLLNTAIGAAGRMWHGLVITASWAVSFVAAGLFCIPRWGTMGSAIAFAVSHVLYLGGGYCYTRFVLRVAYEKTGRLVALTGLTCIVATVVTFAAAGLSLYLATALLLAGLIAAEWFWVCLPAEREACRQSLARLYQTQALLARRSVAKAWAS
jgi:O-antigen/teichoic acid export membrane protein